MTRALALLALLLAPAAAAQVPVTPGEYEALSEGQTLHYSHRGRPFGAEQYFTGRRSLWRFTTGECSAGQWHVEGKSICFTYDGQADVQCWRFLRSGDKLRAVLQPGGGASEPDFALDLTHIDDTQLACPGPEVGM